MAGPFQHREMQQNGPNVTCCRLLSMARDGLNLQVPLDGARNGKIGSIYRYSRIFSVSQDTPE
ncbi:hypothetical protein BDZ91DRAFT_132946 [Kalaharituber pfeilii]|nr:hypothetical protein BDZ91DRAFT_132946 [Kalaharituber pfeilii]